MASVLKDEPDYAMVPDRLRPLLKRCLEKDPKKRLRDVADAMALIAEPVVAAPAPARMGWLWPAAAGVLALGLAGTAWRLWPKPPELPRVVRFNVTLPDGIPITNIPAVSPDGRYLLLQGTSRDDKRQYYLRPADV